MFALTTCEECAILAGRSVAELAADRDTMLLKVLAAKAELSKL